MAAAHLPLFASIAAKQRSLTWQRGDGHRLPAATTTRVRFHRADATEEEDGLTQWAGKRQTIPAAVSLASFDYQTVATLHGTETSTIEQGAGMALQHSLTDYDPQTLYYAPDSEQLSHYARLRQQAYERDAKTFTGSGTVRGLIAGAYFRLDDHPGHDHDHPEQREFVVTRQTLAARNNLPSELAQRLPAALRPTPPGDDTPFHTTFTAIRRGIPLTPAYSDTPHAKPRALGAQTATVVGPAAEEIHTDAHGRIKVQFHWQRPDEHPTIGANDDDTSSCWLRVALPSAGAGWGHQFIPRIGQEVLVDFLEGDIDRPVITGVLYNGSHPPPTFSDAGALPGNKTLSGIKSKEHHGSQFGELLFDDSTGEVRTRLASEHGKTQLSLGYLTHPRSNGKATARGDGFELRTDRHGAVRAAHGLLISTEAQPGAGGKQLARSSAQSQLDAALSLAQSLADTAAAQQADRQETGPEAIQPDNSKGSKQTSGHLQHHAAALRAWEAGSNTDKTGNSGKEQAGQQALLVLSAAGGLAATAEQSLTQSAGSNIDQVAQRDLNQTAGRRWISNVGQHLSVFVAGVRDKVSLKLIAAKGKVQLQAQSDGVEVTADRDVTVTACKDSITIAAKEEILLNVGGGAYIRMTGGNIDVHCPGTVSVKGAEHDVSGGTSLAKTFNIMPNAKFDDKYQLINEVTKKPLAKQRYLIFRENGETENGITDENGFTHMIKNPDRAENISILVI